MLRTIDKNYIFFRFTKEQTIFSPHIFTSTHVLLNANFQLNQHVISSCHNPENIIEKSIRY